MPDEKIPEELFHLDMLDGSPPCSSVFSTAGAREEGWNTEKVFREGQAKQRLDDLFLYFNSDSEEAAAEGCDRGECEGDHHRECQGLGQPDREGV